MHWWQLLKAPPGEAPLNVGLNSTIEKGIPAGNLTGLRAAATTSNQAKCGSEGLHERMARPDGQPFAQLYKACHVSGQLLSRHKSIMRLLLLDLAWPAASPPQQYDFAA